MRRACLLALLVTLVGGAVPFAPPAGARGRLCTVALPLRFSPGFTMTPSRISFSSGGQRGAIKCPAGIAGAAVTGPGTIGAKGTLRGLLGGANCIQEAGAGTVSIAIPTARGMLKLRERVEIRRVGETGIARSSSLAWTYAVRVLEGDCITRPVTAVLLVGPAVLLAHASDSRATGIESAITGS
ncbi:MAG: hypothetical protein M3198_02760 [Actinomycetota bacterium]|nr:hypothetical protein [Actinomycetota bacterium]